MYTVSITTNASWELGNAVAATTGTIGVTAAGALVINGISVDIAADDNLANVILKINNVSDSTGVVATTGGSPGGLLLTTTEYGSSATINVSGSNDLLVALGLVASGGGEQFRCRNRYCGRNCRGGCSRCGGDVTALWTFSNY